jgi:rod shape-determining protein MreC
MFRSLRRLRGLRLIYLGIVILFTYFVLIKGNVLYYIVSGMHHVVGQPSDEEPLTPEQASDLLMKVDELQTKVLYLSEENFLLRRAVNLDDAADGYGYPYKLASVVEADVIFTDHGAVYQTAILDCGSADGVMKGDPVVGTKGLVGRVVDVESRFCHVQLLTNPECRFGAIIRGTMDNPRGTREIGVVVGNQNGIEMRYLGKHADVRVGDLVLTSGDSGLTPTGILIGEVDQKEDREDELMLRVVVKPATDFGHLDYVLVLKYGRSPRN